MDTALAPVLVCEYWDGLDAYVDADEGGEGPACVGAGNAGSGELTLIGWGRERGCCCCGGGACEATDRGVAGGVCRLSRTCCRSDAWNCSSARARLQPMCILITYVVKKPRPYLGPLALFDLRRRLQRTDQPRRTNFLTHLPTSSCLSTHFCAVMSKTWASFGLSHEPSWLSDFGRTDLSHEAVGWTHGARSGLGGGPSLSAGRS
jgi:hypothetical protein